MVLASFWHTILGFLFMVLSLLLMLVILLQRGRGVGLSGAFGGAGGAGATFGAKTGDFLTWTTIVGAGIWLFFAVILNFVFRPSAPILGPSISAPPGQAPASTPPGSSANPAERPDRPDYAQIVFEADLA
ncbi:preprotein translocase subunit SecG [Phycisphaerae bacterium RAS1]|nr:preprotein translocase subunit SecG [Phycisphaerae bacterium RAS1]